MAKIKLTESDLRYIVENSANKIMKGLDFRTIKHAQEVCYERANKARKEGNLEKWNFYNARGDAFREAYEERFHEQSGINWDSKDPNVQNAIEYITYRDIMPEDDVYDYFRNHPNIDRATLKKYYEILQQDDDYKKGKSEYIPGKGWTLKKVTNK